VDNVVIIEVSSARRRLSEGATTLQVKFATFSSDPEALIETSFASSTVDAALSQWADSEGLEVSGVADVTVPEVLSLEQIQAQLDELDTELQDAQFALEQARVDLDIAQASVDAAKITLDAAQDAVDQQQANFETTTTTNTTTTIR
jgi:hypothetical protein